MAKPGSLVWGPGSNRCRVWTGARPTLVKTGDWTEPYVRAGAHRRQHARAATKYFNNAKTTIKGKEIFLFASILRSRLLKTWLRRAPQMGVWRSHRRVQGKDKRRCGVFRLAGIRRNGLCAFIFFCSFAVVVVDSCVSGLFGHKAHQIFTECYACKVAQSVSGLLPS